MVSKYNIPEYYGEEIDSILDHRQYRKCVCKIDLSWLDNSQRTDVLIFNKAIHLTELDKNLSFDSSIDSMTCTSITNIIIDF